MLAQALGIYRRHFVALVLTCALPLIPANLVMAGAVVFGLASMGAGNVSDLRTHSGEVREKQQQIQEQAPASDEDHTARLRQLGREAFEGGTAFDTGFLETVLPFGYVIVVFCGVLLIGLALAQAAVVPLVIDGSAGKRIGPAHAWAAAGARFGALLWTLAIGVPLVVVGLVLCVVPGLIAAVGFSFAIPVTMLEGISGRAALERSWSLARQHWLPILGVWVVIGALTVLASALAALAPAGISSAAVSTVVRLATYPVPLVALVLLYQHARSGPGQYMRRISAPG